MDEKTVKNVEKQSKIYRKSFTLLYQILIRLINHLYPTQIANQLNMDKQKIFYHVHNLERRGYIKKEFKDAIENYTLTEKGEKLFQEIKLFIKSKKSALYVTKSNIRSHNLAVKLKIIRSNPNADFSNELSYNVNPANKGKIFVIAFPISMTVEIYQENVIIDFHKFYTQPTTFMNDFFIRLWKGMLYVNDYLARKYDIRLDLFEPEIVRFHLANERPDLDNKVKEKVQVTIGLGRKAKVIFPSETDAKAWIDKSHGHVDIETNDLLYEEKLLLMPESIDRLANQQIKMNLQTDQRLNDFSKNIASHTEAIKIMNIRNGESSKAITTLSDSITKLTGIVERLERPRIRRIERKHVSKKTNLYWKIIKEAARKTGQPISKVRKAYAKLRGKI